MSAFLSTAPVISITDADGDVAENGRELHSDSKVCSKFFMPCNTPLSDFTVNEWLKNVNTITAYQWFSSTLGCIGGILRWCCFTFHLLI